LAAGDGEQHAVAGEQQQRHQHDGGDRDAELEYRVGQHRTLHARQPAFDQPGAEREAAHVRREHRGDGEFGRAEHQRELARPRSLVDECRRPAEHEAQHEQQQFGGGDVAFCRGRGGRG
jgi:hypothetical protein